jgi:hypothetical protein
MELFAHAGHWLVQLIYLVPLLVLVAVIGYGKVKERRPGQREPRAASERS